MGPAGSLVGRIAFLPLVAARQKAPWPLHLATNLYGRCVAHAVGRGRPRVHTPSHRDVQPSYPSLLFSATPADVPPGGLQGTQAAVSTPSGPQALEHFYDQVINL